MNYTVTIKSVPMGVFTTLQEAVDAVADYARLGLEGISIEPTEG